MQLSDIITKLFFSVFFLAFMVSSLDSSPVPERDNGIMHLPASPVAERDLVHIPAPAASLFSKGIEAPFFTRLRNHVRPFRRRHNRRRFKSIFSRILAANRVLGLSPLSIGNDVDLWQGDIVMSRQMRRALRHSDTDSVYFPRRSRRNRRRGQGRVRDKRGATNEDLLKWPVVANGEVHIPYVIESTSASAEALIKSAMAHWTTNVPCIKFVKRTTQPDYISFFKGAGCYSPVGRVGGKQRISIGQDCLTMGVIAHEIGHALGFWHEQSRPDRDQFVKILLENVQSGKTDEFKKITSIDSLGVPYDFDSLMHYPPTAFAKTSGLNTMVKKSDGSTDFGHQTGLSRGDIEQAKRMYCNSSGGCQHTDLHAYCPWWASTGSCNSSDSKDYMAANCKRSCLCNVCEDKDADCKTLASAGYCTNASYQNWMSVYCKTSCNLCT